MNSRPYNDHDLPQAQAFIAEVTRIDGDCGKIHVGDFPHRIYNV